MKLRDERGVGRGEIYEMLPLSDPRGLRREENVWCDVSQMRLKLYFSLNARIQLLKMSAVNVSEAGKYTVV